MNECMNDCKNGWVDGWIDVRTIVSLDGWMNH